MNSQDQNLALARYVLGKQSQLVERYIVDGPTKLKEDLGISDEEWQAIFDHLVFNNNLLYTCVTSNKEFFTNMYINNGTSHVREVLEIEDTKYDLVWEVIFDFIAISSEGLDSHVMEHRDRYVTALKARGADFVRKVLGLWKEKYEDNWRKVLDLLLHAVCDRIFSERTYDDGIKAFTMIFNGVREQRPIYKSGIIV